MSETCSLCSSVSSMDEVLLCASTPRPQTRTEIALFEHIQHMDVRLNDVEHRLQERIRMLELRVMQMERQSWKRFSAASNSHLPITPGSDLSPSSRSSSTSVLCSPETQHRLDNSLFQSSSSSYTLNPHWISPILEEDLMPSLPGIQAFPQALLYSSPDLPPTVYQASSDNELETSWTRKRKDKERVNFSAPAVVDGLPLSTPFTNPVSPPNAHYAPLHDALRDILVSHSQDASVQLQLELKHASSERRELILCAMKPLMVPLATHEYGHFLVKRALGMRIEMAQHLHGSFVPLVLSPYGVHVVMRVLEGTEIWQRAIAKELIHDSLKTTLTTQHSLCVWQKLFSVQWSDPGMQPEIRTCIHDALRGQWLSIANTETGSMLLQHLMKNMILRESDNGVQELLQHFVECVCHPSGVWVVQHMIEHGTSAMREYIAQRLLRSASAVSLSSYGSKAVQCAQRHCSESFQNQYADVLCRNAASHDGTSRSTGSYRPLLIDVAAAQHGLPILTQLLTTTTRTRRSLIINLVRMNAVFLKSNRSGARVCQLCGTYSV